MNEFAPLEQILSFKSKLHIGGASLSRKFFPLRADFFIGRASASCREAKRKSQLFPFEKREQKYIHTLQTFNNSGYNVLTVIPCGIPLFWVTVFQKKARTYLQCACGYKNKNIKTLYTYVYNVQAKLKHVSQYLCRSRLKQPL